ncbi:MAG: hypothetical protein PVSMB7_07770 [Chloroflexota bacterium]
MSFSLALVPVALALRVVMGKDNFQRWIEETHVKVPTTFTDEIDLVRTVKQAGYDAQKWGGVRKTHVQGDKRVVMWELVDGEWVAVFAKADGEAFVHQVMQDLENKAGRQIFKIKTPVVEITPRGKQSFPTNFRDKALLLQALRDYGVNASENPNGEITCMLGSSTIHFCPAMDGPYSVEVDASPDLPHIYQQLAALDDDYKRSVQAMVYDKLKRRIHEKNMAIESEQVMEDNSILLTLTVPD